MLSLGCSQENLSQVESSTVPNAEPTPRLVIHQIVMENFKSYAGRQVIGPFHKSFTSIVGPNGSGKSNVIDAFMFVLGFRAKKMRQAKLSELIHNSEGMLDVDSCTVEVHFRTILDDPSCADGFQVVAGSDLVVSRTAYRNSRNVYAVNGQTKSHAEVTAMLKGHGIDLDHNRFLILQGEVESIAQMKPKAANEHEEGLLEYLEDIIGTSDYISQIEEAAKAMEAAAEAYTEKNVRVRAASKECEGLVGEKEKAEGFLRQENALTELKNQKLQGLAFKARKDSSVAEARLKENKSKLEQETAKFQEEKGHISAVNQALELKSGLLKQSEDKVDRIRKELQKLEQDDVRMQETRKHLKTKLKGLSKSLVESQKQKASLGRDFENVSLELRGINEQVGSLQRSLEHEEGELEKICRSLQGVTGKYQSQLEEKQKLLIPFQEKIRQEQQALELACSTRDVIKQKEAASGVELAQVQERIREIEGEMKAASEDKERLEEEHARLARQMKAAEGEIAGCQERIAVVGKEVDVLNATLMEAKESLSQANTGNAILLALMKEKRSGRIPGVHGRLGDLGAIDGKYDTAISTACGFLNHIVVDTTETGQRCIEHLRKHNLGRANFIILDKMRPARAAPSDVPRGARRLYDLVRIKDARLYSGAFFFALNDTLVADTIEEATSWAYNGSRRNRVVTVDGKLIETSGTISGGGRPQRGGMKSSLAAADGVTQEQVEQLEGCWAERKQDLRKLTARLAEVEHERQRALEALSKNEALRIKAAHLCTNLPIELADLEQQLPSLKQSASKLSKGDAERLKAAERSIGAAEAAIRQLESEKEPIQAEIAAIQAQIMDAGGIKFKTQAAKVDGLKEQIEHLTGRAKKLATEKATLESRMEALESHSSKTKGNGSAESELADLETKIQEHTTTALELSAKLEQAAADLGAVREEHEELSKQLAAHEKSLSKFKKIEYELKVKIEQDEETLQDATRVAVRCQSELAALALHHIDLKDSKPVLTVYEEGEEGDLVEIVKRLDSLEHQIRSLADRLSTMNPNLRVLEEYRQKEGRLEGLQAELADLDAARQACRARFEDLRQRRHDEFMAGFRTISQRLKEMYQLITMGGNAELELVDSLDPFSEGILFSVMPPKKSWKNISNLSGGEKTLSSLALVFALHTYKPTPIYVMDEIDAALDFRNVSIVAHYIKERTRNAQFIVISLRNDMFELADRLVGIYKTDQRTRSVTIDPKNFALPTVG